MGTEVGNGTALTFAKLVQKGSSDPRPRIAFRFMCSTLPWAISSKYCDSRILLANEAFSI